MKQSKIIFIGGIHGVGKTTICQKIAATFNIEYFSASSLIQKEKKEEYERGKQVSQVEGNQEYLLKAIKKNFNNEKWYLLDGHFCLLNRNNKITKIPCSTYEFIFPSAIIVLIDNPDDICKRLESRDHIKYNVELLKELQDEELAYAKYLTNYLGIPYFSHCPFDNKNENKMLNFIKKNMM